MTQPSKTSTSGGCAAAGGETCAAFHLRPFCQTAQCSNRTAGREIVGHVIWTLGLKASLYHPTLQVIDLSVAKIPAKFVPNRGSPRTAVLF